MDFIPSFFKMAVLLLCSVVIGCSSGPKTAKQEAAKDTVFTPKPGMVTAPKDCEGIRSKILAIIAERIPELETIGKPYITRITNGTATLAYSTVHCPQADAADTLLSKYYSIGAGDGSERSAFWYQIFIAKDLRTILIAEMMQPEKPLDQVRSSAKWKNDWRERQ